MKQTNSAIKYLMAQYRAIFHNAYFKGLATATLVTLALSSTQVQAAGQTFKGNELAPVGENPTVIIDSTPGVSDTTDTHYYSKLEVENTIDKKFANVNFIFKSPESKVKSPKDRPPVYFTGKSILIDIASNHSASDDSLLILTEGTDSFFDLSENITVKRGKLTLGTGQSGDITATGAPTVHAPIINIGLPSTTNNEAIVELYTHGTLGNKFTNNSAMSDLATININKGATLKNTTVALPNVAADTFVNAGQLNINGGKILLENRGPVNKLNINLVKGNFSDANIELLDDQRVLNITFKKALKATGSKELEDNVLDFTSGRIYGNGSIVVSGDTGVNGIFRLNAAPSSTEGVELKYASGSLTINSGATLETAWKNIDNLVVQTNLKTKIAGGTLKFNDKENIELDGNYFNLNDPQPNSKIGITAGSYIVGNDLTLKGDMGDLNIEATKINVETLNSAALTNTKIKVYESLVAGEEAKVKTATLSAGDFVKIKQKIDNANPSLSEAQLNSQYEQALLSASGTIEGKNGSGKLTILGTGSELSIENGTWTNTGVEVVLGDASANDQASLKVGPEVSSTAITNPKNAASLVFAEGSKLNIQNGNVTVGNDTSSTLVSATLDISALNKTGDFTFTKGSITADKNGTIIADASLLDSLATGKKIDIKDGGTLKFVGEKELAADSFTGSSADSKLSLAEGSSLIGDSLKITGSSLSLAKGAKVEAQRLILDNYDSGTDTYSDFSLASGNYTVSQELSSSQDGLLLTANQDVNLSLGILSQNDNGAWSSLTKDGRTNYLYKLAEDSASLKVNAGKWHLANAAKLSEQDIDLVKGSLIVGELNKKDTSGELVGAELSAGKVSQSDTAKLTVNEGSKATFTEFKSQGTKDNTVVKGTLSLLGKETSYLPADPNNQTNPDEVLASYGVSLANMKVSGPNAVLELGKTSLKAIDSITDKVNYKQDKPSGGKDLDLVSGTITIEDYGTLSLDLSALTDSMTLGQIAAIRQEFTGERVALAKGFISLNNMKVSGIQFSGENGTQIEIDELDKFKDFTDIVTDQLANATVVNVGESHVVQGNVGNIQASKNVTNVNVGYTTLSKGENGFATNEAGELIDLTVKEGSRLGLYGGGKAANITLASMESSSNFTTLSISGGDTSIEKIVGESSKTALNLDSGNTTVEKGVTVGKLSSQAGSKLIVSQGDLELTATGEMLSNLKGSVQVLKGNTVTKHNTALYGSDNQFVNLTSKAGNLGFYGGSTKISGLLQAAPDATIYVGQYNGNEAGYSGQLQASLVNLNNGNLFLDPDYSTKASTAEIGSFTDSTSKTDISTIDGNIYVGQNAALLVGQDLTQAKAYLASLQNEQGSLNKNHIGSVFYVNDQQLVKDNKRIIVDSSLNTGNFTGIQGLANTKYDVSRSYTSAQGVMSYAVPNLYIGANSALTIGNGANKQDGAIKFESTDASIYAEEGSKIVLDGSSFMQASRNVVLFTDKGGDGQEGVKILENDIEVETSNGLLHFILKANEETTGGTLEVNKNKLNTSLTGASAPMYNFLMGYAYKAKNWQDKLHNTPVPIDTVLGEVESQGFVKLDAQGSIVLSELGKKFNATAPKDQQILASNYVLGADNRIYHIAYNSFLEQVLGSSNGLAGDEAARMGDFGGATKTALIAANSSYEAIAGRFGIGSQAQSAQGQQSTPTTASNGQGSALWLTPIYKSHEADGFDADGLSYGNDITLYGLALGGDISYNHNLRIGALFNIGQGDSDGQGAAKAVSNDFEYLGAALYAAYEHKKFTVVGDLSYTVLDSDIEGNTEAGKVTTAFDTQALALGVTAKYPLKVKKDLNVTPHAGLRYTRIDMDDYVIRAGDFGDVGEYSAGSSDVISIPLGVNISKEFVSGTWTVKPNFNLTVTGNFGDDEVGGVAKWHGVSNWNLSTNAQFVDSFTYGAALGVSAHSGQNLALGLGLNYTGSSNTNEFGLSANAQYQF